MFKVTVAEWLLSLGLPLLLMLAQEFSTPVAEWLIRALARQLPRRRERREAEWLANLERVPPGFRRLFHALGYVKAAVAAQSRPVGLVLLGLVMSMIRMAVRVAAAPLMVWMMWESGAQALQGQSGLDDLLGLLVLLTMFSAAFPKDAVDFSWVPNWRYPERVMLALASVQLVSLVGLAVVGEGTLRGAALLMLAAAAVSVLTALLPALVRRRARH
ncbi:hypothetical protein [Deinococcus multiflagellatus]|uniref:Uncharacterized protein n=1 Tax=Deinococcus multiflagellatus TaxID=1656887 RepID=A0ABW1ZPH6_9DEIO|nr:hypothetical protein [Deinococcus multiflagellatus]MBZ9715628.1 hypothetical protein [Deinococcus multiflagellatus]